MVLHHLLWPSVHYRAAIHGRSSTSRQRPHPSPAHRVHPDLDPHDISMAHPSITDDGQHLPQIDAHDQRAMAKIQAEKLHETAASISHSTEAATIHHHHHLHPKPAETHLKAGRDPTMASTDRQQQFHADSEAKVFKNPQRLAPPD
ncbi:hypothetical protein ACLOJK_019197 [Asimina triloba]